MDITSIGAAAGSAPRERDSSNLGQEDFLKLMTTQLRNQDPMSPMENGEFMTQIAQFTTASGIGELQSSFAAFQQDMKGDQALRASTLVNRDVLVESSQVQLGESGGVDAVVPLPGAVPGLTVSVTDAAGQVVRRLELGRQPAGEAAVSWDGRNAAGERLPPGRYSITATAGSGEQSLSLPTLVAARVESVALSGGGEPPRLSLAGLGEVSLAAVRRIQ